MSVIPRHSFKAEDEIRNGRTTMTNVEDIKKWLKFKPNIPEMSLEQIVIFLIACENVIENTQHTIETYFRYKSTCPELFQKRDMDNKDIQFTFKVTKMGLSPNRTKDNYAVGIGMLKDTTYYNFHIEPQIKTLNSLVDVAQHSHPPDGLVFIINMAGVGIMHITRLKIGAIRKFLGYLQEAFPIRLRQVHILNSSYVFEKILALMKPFMRRELFEMIIPHPTNMPMEEFFEKYVPANCIPSDFEGELPSLEELSKDLQDEIRKLKMFLDMDDQQVKLYKKEI